MAKITSFRESGPRYPTLRIIGLFFTVIGVLLVLAAAGLLVMIGLHAMEARGGPLVITLKSNC